jgi:membrane-associated phospholipid phosphatase
VNASLSTDVARLQRAAPAPVPAAPTIAWPGLPHVARTVRYSLLTTALFVVVFGGADAISRLHGHRVDLSTSADAVIPFVPETTLIYSSLYLMFWLVPFVLRTEHEVRTLARVIAWEVLIAAPFFIVLPMDELVIPADLGRFAGAFRAADLINLRHNLFPSLHAAFAMTLAVVLGSRCRWPGRAGFALWGLAIGASTVLTRQHVLVDLAGALALTAAVLWRAWPGLRDTMPQRQP